MYVKKTRQNKAYLFLREKIEVAEVKRKGTQIVCTKLSQTVTKGRSFFHCKTEKKLVKTLLNTLFEEEMLWPLLGAR